MSDLAARALLTYLLHSTLLLGLAALVRRALGERRLAVQEAVLRAALAGAFATTALQLGLDLQPLGGALRLQASARANRQATDPAVATASRPLLAVPAARLAPVAAPRWEARLVLAPTPAERALALASGVSWRQALASAWAALAAFALLRLGVAALRLRRLLRDREPLRDARLVPQAARLAGALGLPASVRLSTAPHLSFAGAHLPELVVPIPLHLLLGRRLSFGIFVWLARHAPWALQEPEHENSFIKLARQGRPKHDDLLEKVRIPRLRGHIRQAGLTVVSEALQVTGTFRRAPAAVVRWLREAPLVQDIVVGNVEYVLVRDRKG
jgi:hypothetical protein